MANYLKKLKKKVYIVQEEEEGLLYRSGAIVVEGLTPSRAIRTSRGIIAPSWHLFFFFFFTTLSIEMCIKNSSPPLLPKSAHFHAHNVTI